MTSNEGLYDYAKAYDLAFSYRDYSAEVDFLLGFFEGSHPKKALEIAAGPARHALEMGKRGVSVDAIDLSPDMKFYSERLFSEHNLGIDYYLADMRNFSLPLKYDLIFNMVDSISHIPDLTSLKSHLSAVAEHLHSGGLYIIEAAHPKALEDDSKTVNKWKSQNEEMTVIFTWQEISKPTVSAPSYKAEVSMKITENGRENLIIQKFKTRVHSSEDFLTSIDKEKLVLKYFFGDFNKTPVDDDQAWRMIIVLQRL